MTLGPAALSAWGVEHFQSLTAGLELPLPQAGEAAAELEARAAEYSSQLGDAGLALFHDFLRIAGAVALLAILPALAMGGDRLELGSDDGHGPDRTGPRPVN